MTLLEAIPLRHSVRAYKNQPLSPEVVEALQKKITEVNAAGNLNVQLVTDEPKAFSGPIARYGRFSGVTSYLVMAGHKCEDLDEKVGYYGEQLVLAAQTLGLNSCWVGVSYSKIPGTYTLAPDEKIACYIALGYGQTQGTSHKIKTAAEVSNISDSTPEWFAAGVNAALLAPTAVNQQKFHFEYIVPDNAGDKARVIARQGFSLVGYTQMDLGIAKFHFELAAGLENFDW